ncbi:PLP-dependent transferase, partial [Candidatus Parvarchaeota archaeon]|nr:PLP-dependent transferase [Candidatus Parvarchaeota archaeon]
MKFETKAVHIGEEPKFGDGASGDVVVPIHLSSTFARMDADKPTAGYEYSRSGNPTRDALEKRLAALEGAKYGLAFSSGLAAQAVLGMGLLRCGDHVVASDDLYEGTRRLFDNFFKANFGVEISYVDSTSPAEVEKAIGQKTRLIWLETPTNPLLKLADIRGISQIASKKGVLVAVDNTFASPYLQQPMALGADIAVHSTTKYINGHSDSIGGAIALSEAGLFEKLKHAQNAIGAILSPFDSYLVLRGIKTLALRMDMHSANAQKIAEFLESHEKVKRVIYPGLKSHPQHRLARVQMKDFGGMISFEISGDEKTGASLRNAKKFLSRLKLFHLAESLGGVESLIEHPSSMTHASIPVAVRKKIGISDSLIRVSVGIEN